MQPPLCFFFASGTCSVVAARLRGSGSASRPTTTAFHTLDWLPHFTRTIFPAVAVLPLGTMNFNATSWVFPSYRTDPFPSHRRSIISSLSITALTVRSSGRLSPSALFAYHTSGRLSLSQTSCARVQLHNSCSHILYHTELTPRLRASVIFNGGVNWWKYGVLRSKLLFGTANSHLTTVSYTRKCYGSCGSIQKPCNHTLHAGSHASTMSTCLNRRTVIIFIQLQAVAHLYGYRLQCLQLLLGLHYVFVLCCNYATPYYTVRNYKFS